MPYLERSDKATGCSNLGDQGGLDTTIKTGDENEKVANECLKFPPMAEKETKSTQDAASCTIQLWWRWCSQELEADLLDLAEYCEVVENKTTVASCKHDLEVNFPRNT